VTERVAHNGKQVRMTEFKK